MLKITAGQSIQSVMNAHSNECVFEIEPAVYDGMINFIASNQSKTLIGSAGVIITSHSPYSILINPDAYNISLFGLTIKNQNPSGTIIGIQGPKTRVENCLITGDSINGQHRGIEANAESILIRKTKVDNCFSANQDAQAICGWKFTDNLLIDSCYLAGGQSLMLGGSDGPDLFSIPTNVKLINSVLTRSSNWPRLKNALELKNCINFHAFNCQFDYSGNAAGQKGFLLVFTPRNQNGKAFWSQIKNVLIEHCTGAHASGVAQFLGQDTHYNSETLENIIIRDCHFTDISHIYPGRNWLFQFEKSPSNITLSDLTVEGDAHSAGYFIGDPPINLTIKNLKLPVTPYQWKIDNGGSGIDAVMKYAPTTRFL
jgi:hypothetical protein